MISVDIQPRCTSEGPPRHAVLEQLIVNVVHHTAGDRLILPPHNLPHPLHPSHKRGWNRPADLELASFQLFLLFEMLPTSVCDDDEDDDDCYDEDQ